MTKGQKKGEPAPFRVFEMYEDQIIQMVADGYNYDDIAEKIPPLNQKLIINYIRLIMRKWGANNRPHLIHLWHESKRVIPCTLSPVDHLTRNDQFTHVNNHVRTPIASGVYKNCA